MEIQQHDGVVVDVAGLRQGFAELLRERERCCRGGGRGVGLRRKRDVLVCLGQPKPQLYIGGEGAAPPLGFPPQEEAASPRSHPRGAAKGRRGGAPLGWALRPIWT